jgi:hypothetical protein
MSKTKKIKYQSHIEEYPNNFVPAKAVIPEWYKKATIKTDDPKYSGLKRCAPFLDAMSSGYVVKLAFDLHVENKEGQPFVTWDGSNNEHPPIKWRDHVSETVMDGFYSVEYLWNMLATFKVPAGYNMLVTHPLNRYDLPFVTLSGIVEGDFAIAGLGNLPFYIKKDFSGIIPQGTPILQVIPFKNESWESVKTEGLCKEGQINSKRSSLVFAGYYKNNIWKRKNYT